MLTSQDFNNFSAVLKTDLFGNNIPSLGFLRRNCVWHFVLIKARFKLNFWCIVKKQTNLFDNILRIEIVEHVKLLLCDRWENSFERALRWAVMCWCVRLWDEWICNGCHALQWTCSSRSAREIISWCHGRGQDGVTQRTASTAACRLLLGSAPWPHSWLGKSETVAKHSVIKMQYRNARCSRQTGTEYVPYNCKHICFPNTSLTFILLLNFMQQSPSSFALHLLLMVFELNI